MADKSLNKRRTMIILGITSAFIGIIFIVCGTYGYRAVSSANEKLKYDIEENYKTLEGEIKEAIEGKIYFHAYADDDKKLKLILSKEDLIEVVKKIDEHIKAEKLPEELEKLNNSWPDQKIKTLSEEALLKLKYEPETKIMYGLGETFYTSHFESFKKLIDLYRNCVKATKDKEEAYVMMNIKDNELQMLTVIKDKMALMTANMDWCKEYVESPKVIAYILNKISGEETVVTDDNVFDAQGNQNGGHNNNGQNPPNPDPKQKPKENKDEDDLNSKKSYAEQKPEANDGGNDTDNVQEQTSGGNLQTENEETSSEKDNNDVSRQEQGAAFTEPKVNINDNVQTHEINESQMTDTKNSSSIKMSNEKQQEQQKLGEDEIKKTSDDNEKQQEQQKPGEDEIKKTSDDNEKQQEQQKPGEDEIKKASDENDKQQEQQKLGEDKMEKTSDDNEKQQEQQKMGEDEIKKTSDESEKQQEQQKMGEDTKNASNYNGKSGANLKGDQEGKVPLGLTKNAGGKLDDVTEVKDDGAKSEGINALSADEKEKELLDIGKNVKK